MLAKISVDWSVVWHTNCEPVTVPTVTLGDPARPVAVPVQLPDDPVTLPVTLPVIVLVALIVVHVIPPADTVPTVTLGDPVRPVAGPEKLTAVTAPVNEADVPETAPLHANVLVIETPLVALSILRAAAPLPVCRSKLPAIARMTQSLAKADAE